MIYDSGKGEFKNWIIKEEVFSADFPEKTESIMCLGNGYMGQRAANEDYYRENSRFNLVAGTFDYLDGDLATELPNNADVTNCTIFVDGEQVTPVSSCENYEKTLNLKTGLLRRSYDFTSKKGKKLSLEFLRVVSLSDVHLISSKIKIKSNKNCKIEIVSGIDGNVYHCEHFNELDKRLESGILYLITQTKDTGVLFCTMTTNRFELDGKIIDTFNPITSDNHLSIFENIEIDLGADQELTITKISSVFTNRDKERNDCDKDTLKKDAMKHMNNVRKLTFEIIAKESKDEWQRRIWDKKDVIIDSNNEFDQLSIRFAIYHLTVMSPTHDNRMNIGAKGLSGPGYRGHTFWDTEIFMLPFFIFTSPSEARSLLEYRFNCLDAAKKNAKERGYEGAMFPWEAAWVTDGETTPSWARTGLLEHHITADVAYGVYTYYIITGDDDFMNKYGYELLFETAKFWSSRLSYNEEKDRYEILTVIGPDEYKEDVDNNAYTNYLAQYNLFLALKYLKKLKDKNSNLYYYLLYKCNLRQFLPAFKKQVNKIYLPRENEDGLVPQDDTYLTLIDIVPEDKTLSEMKDEAHSIAYQLGRNKVMISKQADVMLLMYLFEDHFTQEIKKKNFYFYEKRCIHDSSLSLSTYSALAADLGEKETAYKLYERAERIDLGEDMKSSDEGVHSASLGGIWQMVVFGFMGVRRYGNDLRIEPHLPDEWKSAKVNIIWQGTPLEIFVKKDVLIVTNISKENIVKILHKGQYYIVEDQVEISLIEVQDEN